jgi:hypothetical protein
VGAERQAQADLARLAGHGVRQQAIESCARQNRRRAGKKRGQRRQHALGDQRLADPFVDSLQVHRYHAVDAARFAADRLGHCRWRAGAQLEEHVLDPLAEATVDTPRCAAPPGAAGISHPRPRRRFAGVCRLLSRPKVICRPIGSCPGEESASRAPRSRPRTGIAVRMSLSAMSRPRSSVIPVVRK